jgi:hypothetical protein
MKTSFLAAILCLALILAGALPAAPRAAWAQTAEQPASAEEAPGPEPQDSLPHGKFLFDYLLVAVLLAGALYAVCRSSRRV